MVITKVISAEMVNTLVLPYPLSARPQPSALLSSTEATLSLKKESLEPVRLPA